VRLDQEKYRRGLTEIDERLSSEEASSSQDQSFVSSITETVNSSYVDGSKDTQFVMGMALFNPKQRALFKK